MSRLPNCLAVNEPAQGPQSERGKQDKAKCSLKHSKRPRTRVMSCLCWAPSFHAALVSAYSLSLAGVVWRLPCSSAPLQKRPGQPAGSTGRAKCSPWATRSASMAGTAPAAYQCNMILPGPFSKCPSRSTAISACRPFSHQHTPQHESKELAKARILHVAIAVRFESGYI